MAIVQPLAASISLYPKADARLRLFALWYFSVLITIWWVGGVLFLGFEQSWLQFATGISVTLGLQVLLMWVHVKTHPGLRLPWEGGFGKMVNFLLPAYPPGVAVVMLLFPNERLWPIVFAATLAIASKPLLRAPIGNGQTQHIFNPSNLGISATLLLFPSVGLAPPYHFTENITGAWDWIVPAVVLASGILVHSFSTGRWPLILAWIAGFIAQGLLRSWWFGTPMLAPLAPMTSVAFILFTLYMIPDPGTTPLKAKAQVLFGLALAATYGLLQVNHILFGLMLSLTLVCAMRGLWLFVEYGLPGRREAVPTTAAG